ncbi:MAG: PPE family protein [Actinomycetota bacterium]|nr:PPE family protein [Actinomycetota bacterium]
MPPGAYQAEPPEATSAQFWLGPGAGTFFSSAANLKALAAAIIAMLGGHVSTEAAMAASWPSLSGEIARLAHTPHLGWLATAGAMVAEAGMAIDATAASFETSKFATPHPGEVAANQSEHVALNSANFLGFLTPLIIANRVDYGRMWMQGVTNKYAYEAGSVPLQTVPPVPPPPPSTVGGAGSGTPGLDQAAAEAGAPMDSFFQQMTGMLPAIGQMPMSLMQSVGSGGPLKSLTQVPEQLLGQMGSLASAANLSPEAGLGGLASPDWVTATPLAGGAVNASLAGGGGAGGFGGAGTVSAASALRSPGSWASAVSAAPATGESTSRFSEVRPQATTVPASSGGGMGGAMAPMAHGAAAAGAQNNDDKKEQTEPGQVLVSAADLFRSSEAMPVITGGGGLTRASEPGGKEAPV